MSNELNFSSTPSSKTRRDINVVQSEVEIKTGIGSTIFEIALWLFMLPGLILLIYTLLSTKDMTLLIIGVVLFILGLLPGLIYTLRKISAGNYLSSYLQKINAANSEIDNYENQKEQILQEFVGLVKKSIEVDEKIFENLASLRTSGMNKDELRNKKAEELNNLSRSLHVALENYPTLKSQDSIQKAMNEEVYLDKEITEARRTQNDIIARWNSMIYEWPCKKIVASKRHYTTIIPFTLDEGTKERARSSHF